MNPRVLQAGEVLDHWATFTRYGDIGKPVPTLAKGVQGGDKIMAFVAVKVEVWMRDHPDYRQVLLDWYTKIGVDNLVLLLDAHADFENWYQKNQICWTPAPPVVQPEEMPDRSFQRAIKAAHREGLKRIREQQKRERSA